MKTKPDRQERLVQLALLVLALLFHLYFIRILWKGPITLYGDAVHYDHAAVLLLIKHVYSYWSWGPAAQVTPGYPLFLEFAYFITLVASHNHQTQMHVAATLQHLMAAVTIVVLYRLMRHFLPRWASVVGALLWMVYPPVNFAANQLLTETLYIFVLLLFTWSFIVAVKQPTFWRWVLAGLLLGLTTLVRPSVLPLIFAPLLLLLKRQNGASIKRQIVNWLGYVAMFVICMIPWWVRNVLVMHRFILTDDDMANPLLFGSDPNFQTDTNIASGLTFAQQEHLAIHRIATGFSHQPLYYLKWYTIDKLGLLFGTPWYETRSGLGLHPSLSTRLLFDFAQLHIVWVILGCIGLLFGAFVPYLRWMSGLVLFLVVVQLPFIPINRYVFPVMPFFFIGVMVLVCYVIKAFANNRQTVTNR